MNLCSLFALRPPRLARIPGLIFCLFLACCTLAGCGGQKTPPRTQLKAPAKGAPAKKLARGSKMPATQRPYVIKGVAYYPISSSRGYRERGLASWYGEPFHGRRTSNGELYNMYGDTAAHKTLPMNTVLLVKNLDNGRSTVVRINDRGPFVRERIIDLSYAKAKELGVLAKGTARVEIVALEEVEALPAALNAAAKRSAESAQEKTPPTLAQSRPAAPQQPPPQYRPKKPEPDFDRGNFFVQVGAFAEVAQARALARKFARLGRDVVIQQYPAAGMNLYRVLVFASHSLKEARRYEAQMHASGYKYTLLLAR